MSTTKTLVGKADELLMASNRPLRPGPPDDYTEQIVARQLDATRAIAYLLRVLVARETGQ